MLLKLLQNYLPYPLKKVGVKKVGKNLVGKKVSQLAKISHFLQTKFFNIGQLHFLFLSFFSSSTLIIFFVKNMYLLFSVIFMDRI